MLLRVLILAALLEAGFSTSASAAVGDTFGCGKAGWVMLKPEIEAGVKDIGTFDYEFYGETSPEDVAFLRKEVSHIEAIVVEVVALAQVKKADGSRLLSDGELGETVIGLHAGLQAWRAAAKEKMESPRTVFNGKQKFDELIAPEIAKAQQKVKECQAALVAPAAAKKEKIVALQKIVGEFGRKRFTVSSSYRDAEIKNIPSDAALSAVLESRSNASWASDNKTVYSRDYYSLWLRTGAKDSEFRVSLSPTVRLYVNATGSDSIDQMSLFKTSFGDLAGRLEALFAKDRVTAQQFEVMGKRITALAEKTFKGIEDRLVAAGVTKTLTFKASDLAKYVDRVYDGGRGGNGVHVFMSRAYGGGYDGLDGVAAQFARSKIGPETVEFRVPKLLAELGVQEEMARIEQMLSGFEK